MINQKKFVVSHAPFWHDGSSITTKHHHIFLAALVATIPGLIQYGIPAVAVVTFSISTAILWEHVIHLISKRPNPVGDGNAALIGLLLAMLLPAATPWWVVMVGTLLAILIGKQIFGGLGGNPFNPVLIGLAILSLSWKGHLSFDEALVNYDLNFIMADPLVRLKALGPQAISTFAPLELLIGKQVGGIGATCGITIILTGLYLIIRGFIRWEITLSFIVGVFVTAAIFNLNAPEKYADPLFHLLTGYTLIGAFFLATEDSSSPVNFIPMLIYGAGAGIMTVLIRNIGAYADGVMYAILIMNLINPIIDKIRPKALGKV